MAKMSFTVPESIKQEFWTTFACENKSAIITRMMRQAIEERRRNEQQSGATDKPRP